MYSNDYAAWIIFQSKYKDFRAEAIQSELAHEARKGRKANRLGKVWHRFQTWAAALKGSRKSLESDQGWTASAEASLKK